MLKLQLYLKPQTIGLCFNNQAERDSFWTLLGEHQSCAERFGERTIRFYPAKATAKFSIPLETETPRVIAEPVEVKQIAPKPAPPVQMEAPVIPSAPAPIAAIAIIPSETPTATVGYVPLEAPSTPPLPEPLPAATMPQIGIGDVLHVVEVLKPAEAKPPDLRSRAGRAWKASQQQAATK